MLTVDRVLVKIAAFTILRRLSLEVPARAIVGLVGHNGAGKTTTLRTIMGLVRPVAGEIRLDGEDLTGRAPQERARLGIGYMPEDRRLIAALSVEENILLPAWALGLNDAGPRLDFLYGVLPELAALAGRPARQLSGGQQKMVALARSFMNGRKLLLLDEPFEGVSPALSRRLAEVVRSFRNEGVSVLVAESDPNRVRLLAQVIYTLERGEIVHTGGGSA